MKPDKITYQGNTLIPNDIKSQLPIFKMIGNQLPNQLKTPEAKKTMSKVFFWIILIGGSAAFYKALPSLLAFAERSVLFIIYSILLVVMLLLFPKIVGVLHRIGRTLLWKGEKSFIKRNAIDTLQMLANDAKKLLKQVKEKITSVDGVRINMITDAQKEKENAEEKTEQVKKLTQLAKQLDTEAVELNAKGFTEKANAKKREANEARSNAQLRMAEAQTAEQTSRQYAQYGNQFSKVVEVLKDNESGAKIYVNALESSIHIIDTKLTATNKMKAATEGLADVFNIKDSFVFDLAMSAATEQISQNIASIRSNLDFLNENQQVTIGQASQSELEAFVTQMEGGKLKSLNIQEMTDASHDLTDEEEADKGFKLLD